MWAGLGVYPVCTLGAETVLLGAAVWNSGLYSYMLASRLSCCTLYLVEESLDRHETSYFSCVKIVLDTVFLLILCVWRSVFDACKT